jgi:hypothetical protein
MGATDDGRLELDELGSVIDRASALGPTAADDLLEGNDDPTWLERLESRGVTPWFRRHRVTLAVGTATVVCLGLLGGAWARSQPPPFDPTIDATVADAMSDGMVTEIPGVVYDGFTAVAVHVEPRGGEQVSVLGITGPGIRASRATPNTAATGESVENVFLVPGCDDPRAYTATVDDYRLLVRRTDAYGRTGDGTLVLPSAIAAQLVGVAAQTCFQTQVSESVSVGAVVLAPDVAHHTISARITLHNGLTDDLLVQAVTSASTVVTASGDLVTVPRGGSADQPVRMDLTDCTELIGTRPPSNEDRIIDGRPADLGFFVTPGNGAQAGAELAVPWAPRDRATITTALRAMCAGGPGATAHVLSASPAPVAVSQAYGFTGPNDGVVLRMRVEVTSPGSHLVLSDGGFPLDVQPDVVQPDEPPHQVTTVSTDLRGGRSVVTVDWAAQCSSVVSPPEVWLAATARGATYPYRATLADVVLAHAYSDACPGAIPSDLGGFGWQSG